MHLEHKSIKSFIQRFYPGVVIAGALLALLASLWVAPFNLQHTWLALVIIILVALQVSFPYSLLSREINLAYVILLGASLLYGPGTAAWTAVTGFALGYGSRHFLSKRHISFTAPPVFSWREALLNASVPIIGLAAIWLFFSRRMGAAEFGSVPGTTLVASLLFTGVHGSLTLIDSWSQSSANQSYSKYDPILFVLAEFLPVPFILVTVMAQRAVGAGALIALGGICSIISFLLYGINAAHASLGKRVGELTTLNQVSRALRATLEMDALLDVFHKQLSRILGVENFYVALFDLDRQKIWYPMVMEGDQRVFWPARQLTDRLTDRVISERKPILIPRHGQVELERLGLPAGEDAPAAWMGVPLSFSNRMIGCLAVYTHSHKAEFNQADLDLMVALSGQASIAITNALHYEQARQRAAQLETLNRLTGLITASLDPEEVLEQVCNAVTGVVDAHRSAIYQLDLDAGRVVLANALKLSKRFIGSSQSFDITHNDRTHCLRTGHPSLIPNVKATNLEKEYKELLSQEGIQAVGEFPLSTPDGQIGFLAVYYDNPHEFPSEEVKLLQTFAAQAAMAVSNARLHARTDMALSRRVHQLSILESVGRELAAEIHSDRLFERILDYAMEFTNSSWGRLGLYDSFTLTTTIKAARGYDYPIESMNFGQGLSSRAIEFKQPILVDDVRQDPDFVDFTGGRASSHLSVPLINKAQVLGVLTLESTQSNAFSGSDCAFVGQLADQAAVALLNAGLYAETQRRLHEQMTLYQFSTQLLGDNELDSITNTVSQAMLSLKDSIGVGIYLRDECEKCYSRTHYAGKTQEHLTCLPETIPDREILGLESALADTKPLLLARDGQLPVFPQQCLDNKVWIFPLVIGKERLGMILVETQAQSHLRDETMQLLQAISAQCAIALQNAILFTDITQVRDRLAAVLDSVDEGVLMIDLGGRILLANRSLQAIVGVSEDHLIEQEMMTLPESILSVFGFKPADGRDLVEILGRGQVPGLPKALISGSSVPAGRALERTSAPVWGRGERLIGWMMVLRDVTEEQQIEQAREMLTETLVHDLRSPIGAVLGALDVMDETLRKDKTGELNPTRQALHIARRGAQRMLGLVENLLDIARLESGMLETTLVLVDVHSLVRNVLNEFMPQSREYGISLRNEIPADVPRVRADLNMLSRVLVNLIDNAVKYSPSGGQVSINAQPAGNDMLTIQVADSGPGIPEEFKEKIFDRFSQVPGRKGRWRGTGLGLTFCRLAIEAHSGRIWAESPPSGGSTFLFTLPVASAGGEAGQ